MLKCRLIAAILFVAPLALSGFASAQLQFIQTESYDSQGRYSFIEPGAGEFGEFDWSYVRVESPHFTTGVVTGTQDPAFDASTDIDVFQFGGSMGFTFGKTSDEVSAILGKDFRVVAGGHYWRGFSEENNERGEPTLIIAVDGSNQGRSIVEPTDNEFDSVQSQTDISVLFEGDHYRDDGIIITKSLGYTYMRRANDFKYANFEADSAAELSTLHERLRTDYNGLDLGVAARYRYNEHITLYTGGRLAFFTANSILAAEQTITGVGQFASLSRGLFNDSEFGVRPRAETGLIFETPLFHVGGFFYYEHISYMPQIVNPKSGTDRSAFFVSSSSNLYGIRLEAGVRF